MIVSEIPFRVQAALFADDFWNTGHFWNTHRTRIQKTNLNSLILRRIHSAQFRPTFLSQLLYLFSLSA